MTIQTVVDQLMPAAFLSILDLPLMKFLKLRFGLPSSGGLHGEKRLSCLPQLCL